MKDAAICKEMRKKQKHFLWLKIFLKDFIETYPHQKKALYCLIENVEKEVKELISRGRKTKIERLFETVNDLLIHFWWKIHWKKNRLWKDYWKMDCLYSYHHNKISSCLEKLLYFLIYLGIILSKGVQDSIWINRVLQAINVLPKVDETVYNALLLVNNLKKKYHSSYMEILKHVLCSELILHIDEPVLYIKNIILFRRLRKFIQDHVAKTAVLTTASKIIPPSNIIPWLSSLEVIIKNEDDIVKQLFKKSNFQKLYYVLVVNQKLNMSINCKEENKEQKLSEIIEKQSKSAKKSQNLQAKNRKKVNKKIEKKSQVYKNSEEKQQSKIETNLHRNSKEILHQKKSDLSDNLKYSVTIPSNIDNTENVKNQITDSVRNESTLEKKILVDDELQDVYENSLKICIENNKEQKLKSKSKKKQSKSSKKSQSLKINSIKGINENIELTVQINDVSEKSENKQHSETEADLHKNADDILLQNDCGVSDNLKSPVIVLSNIEDTCLENAKIQTNKSVENEPALEKEVLVDNELQDVYENSSKICIENNKEQKLKSKTKKKQSKSSKKSQSVKVNSIKGINENKLTVQINDASEKSENKQHSETDADLHKNADEILLQNDNRVSNNLKSSATVVSNIEDTCLENAKIQTNKSVENEPILEKEVLTSSEQLDLQEDLSKICYEENKEQKVKSKGKRKQSEKSVKKSQTKKNNENERNLHLNNGLCKVPKKSRKKQSSIEAELNENSNEILHQNKCDVSDNLSSLTIPIDIENTSLEQAKIENNDSIKKRPKEKNDKKKSSSNHKSKKNKHKSKKEVHKSKKKHKSKKEITENKKIKKRHFVNESNTVESNKESYSSVLDNDENVTDLTDLSCSNLIMSNTENNSVQNVNFQSTCSTENKETLEKNDKCSSKIKSKKKKSKKGHKHKKDSKDKNKKKKDSKISKHHKYKKNANKNHASETIKKIYISAKKVDNRESNQNMHVDNLLANFIANCSDEDERENENTSSCPVITSDSNILIPDTCQNDIIPFNLDQQESNNENVIPSKTFEKDYQQILDKSPYIHLTDIATPEKIISFESNHLYGHFKESDSSFHIPNHGIVKDHKVSTASNQSLCESVHSDSQMVENVNNEIRDTNLQNHISYQNNLDHSTFNLNETFQQINTSNKHFSTNKKETRKRAALSDENCTNTDSLGLKTPSTKRRKKLIKNKRSTIDKNPSSQTVDEINYTKSPHKEIDSNMQLNGLSTLLANHGDISIQESEIMNENISSVKKFVCSKSISDSVSDHSESLLPQFLNSTFQEKSNILNNENDIQRPINNISSISLVNDKNHYNDPLMNLDYGNNVTNSVLNACNSEELENACKLSKNQDPEDNSLNSVRLTIETTDNINESACTENEPNCNSFKTTASLTPIDFNSISNLKLSEQHNQRHLIPVASSSPQAGSDISQSPFVHYTNNDHSLIQNSQNTYNASVGHNKEHIFTTNVDLTSDKSNCIIDCKIINESNVTDKSVNMGTSTIKVILNLSCIKPENTSNTHTPENHFSSHCGPSVGVPSVTSGQSNYSVSFPQHNCYFDEPPILTREVNELYTPPVSEHQMSIEIPLSSSKETAHLNKNTNSTSSCLKNKSLTKNSSNEMNSTNLFSNSVNDTNEWNINPLDLNSSFSLISPFRTKDQVNNILKSLDLPGMENNSRPSTNNKSNDSTFKKSDMCSKIPNKKSQKNNSYRNSINSIYSEESEDDISVSTLSIYSGEETDHSFINTTDDEMPSNILKKRKDNSLKNAKKNLFQSFSSSAAFQASTADSSADEETETIEQPTKGSKQQNETLTTSLNHSYNLRSRKSLVKPR